MAAAGSAVGLGNLWKFPYITFDNQGGSFVLVYIVCIAVVGLPIMVTKGRHAPQLVRLLRLSGEQLATAAGRPGDRRVRRLGPDAFRIRGGVRCRSAGGSWRLRPVAGADSLRVANPGGNRAAVQGGSLRLRRCCPLPDRDDVSVNDERTAVPLDERLFHLPRHLDTSEIAHAFRRQRSEGEPARV